MLSKLKNEFKEFKDVLKKTSPILFSILVLTMILMNILSNKALSFSEINISGRPINLIDCGTLLSWIVFLVSSIIAYKNKTKHSIMISYTALFINFIVVVLFIIISYIPGNWSNGSDSLMNEFLRGNAPILVGSFTAFTIGLFLNNFLVNLFKKIFKNKNFMIVSLISSAIAQLIDNFIFTFLSFYLFQIMISGEPWYRLSDCIISAILTMIIEIIIQLVFTPLVNKICIKDNIE